MTKTRTYDAIFRLSNRVGAWLLLAMSSGLLFAQEKSKDKDVVELQVYVIRCTNSHNKVDPELKPLYDQLKSQLKYTGYTVERKIQEKRSIGKPLEIDKLANHKATITPLKRLDDRLTMKVEFEKVEKIPTPNAKPASTTYNVNAGKFFFPQVPEKLPDGDALMLAIGGR